VEVVWVGGDRADREAQASIDGGGVLAFVVGAGVVAVVTRCSPSGLVWMS